MGKRQAEVVLVVAVIAVKAVIAPKAIIAVVAFIGAAVVVARRRSHTLRAGKRSIRSRSGRCSGSFGSRGHSRSSFGRSSRHPLVPQHLCDIPGPEVLDLGTQGQRRRKGRGE